MSRAHCGLIVSGLAHPVQQHLHAKEIVSFDRSDRAVHVTARERGDNFLVLLDRDRDQLDVGHIIGLAEDIYMGSHNYA